MYFFGLYDSSILRVSSHTLAAVCVLVCLCVVVCSAGHRGWEKCRYERSQKSVFQECISKPF